VAEIWSTIAEQGDWPYTEVRPPYLRRESGYGQMTRENVMRQHRREKVWSKIHKQDGALRYALKYAAKQRQKRVPPDYRDVGRFWATSQDVVPKDGIEVPMTEAEVRLLLGQIGRNLESWEVLPKLIWHAGHLTQG